MLEDKTREAVQPAQDAGAAQAEQSAKAAQPARICVMVSGGGTNLQALIDASARGEMPHGRIELVISDNPKAYALKRAEAAGIETLVCARKEFASAADFEAAVRKAIDERKIELIILAGFMRILSGDFTARYPERIINVHPSLIPSFCGKDYYGLHVHEAALAYGVKVTGATVHFVNEIPDGGRIIMQKAVEVKEGDTPETLQRRVMEEAEWRLLPQAAEKICREITAGRGR